jgi:leucyl/phenylalanyl-tRNA--protein transferase
MVRNDGFGTWITDAMEDAYLRLHEIGVAKSIEVWFQNELVGGLYGLEINNIFCGESMFSTYSNASKIAFIYLAKSAKYTLIDCQMYNAHLASLGAKEIERSLFLKILKEK